MGAASSGAYRIIGEQAWYLLGQRIPDGVYDAEVLTHDAKTFVRWRNKLKERHSMELTDEDNALEAILVAMKLTC